jgi:hypothetical protein
MCSIVVTDSTHLTDPQTILVRTTRCVLKGRFARVPKSQSCLASPDVEAKVSTCEPQGITQIWLLSLKSDLNYFRRNRFARLGLRGGSSILLDPATTQVSSLTSKKCCTVCRHPCHSWYSGIGTLCESALSIQPGTHFLWALGNVAPLCKYPTPRLMFAVGSNWELCHLVGDWEFSHIVLSSFWVGVQMRKF